MYWAPQITNQIPVVIFTSIVLRQNKFNCFGSWDQYYKTDFAVAEFMARFWSIICGAKWCQLITYLSVAAIKAALEELQIDGAKLEAQIQIMDQSLAITLRQFNYGKISLIVVVPGLIQIGELQCGSRPAITILRQSKRHDFSVAKFVARHVANVGQVVHVAEDVDGEKATSLIVVQMQHIDVTKLCCKNW